MSLLSRLFGGGKKGGSTRTEPPQDYNGYTIAPAPIDEGGVHRICAVIELERDGEVLSHRMIRADTLQDRDAAVEVSLRKAQQLIDQQGDALFGR